MRTGTKGLSVSYKAGGKRIQTQLKNNHWQKAFGLFHLFIWPFIPPIRGKHNNSLKTWFCWLHSRKVHAKKFILVSQLTGEWQAGLLLAWNAGAGVQLEVARPGTEIFPGLCSSALGSAAPAAQHTQWLSERHLRDSCVLPRATLFCRRKVKQWFTPAFSTAEWSCVCAVTLEREWLFCKTYKTPTPHHDATKTFLKFSEKGRDILGQPIGWLSGHPPGQGGISKIQVSRLSDSRERFDSGSSASQTTGVFPSVIPALDGRRLSHYLQFCWNWHSATCGFDYCKSAFSNEKSSC